MGREAGCTYCVLNLLCTEPTVYRLQLHRIYCGLTLLLLTYIIVCLLFLNIYLFPIYTCGHTHVQVCMWRSEESLRGFSFSIMWFWETKLRSLVLAAGTTAHGAISLAASFLFIIPCLIFLQKQVFHENMQCSRAFYMRMIFQNFSRRQ